MSRAWVCIVMGSDSDAEVMSQAAAALDEFGVPYEMSVASAHRSPERAKQVIGDDALHAVEEELDVLELTADELIRPTLAPDAPEARAD